MFAPSKKRLGAAAAVLAAAIALAGCSGFDTGKASAELVAAPRDGGVVNTPAPSATTKTPSSVPTVKPTEAKKPKKTAAPKPAAKDGVSIKVGGEAGVQVDLPGLSISMPKAPVPGASVVVPNVAVPDTKAIKANAEQLALKQFATIACQTIYGDAAERTFVFAELGNEYVKLRTSQPTYTTSWPADWSAVVKQYCPDKLPK